MSLNQYFFILILIAFHRSHQFTAISKKGGWEIEYELQARLELTSLLFGGNLVLYVTDFQQLYQMKSMRPGEYKI